MPLARCRGFDDDGKEIRGGCRRNDCEFIHPTDPKWTWARKSDHGNSVRGRDRGRGGGKGRDRHPTWGHPPSGLPSKNADPTWDYSSRGEIFASASATQSASSKDTEGNSVGYNKGASTSGAAGLQPAVSDRTNAQGVSGWGSGQGSSWDDMATSGWSTARGDHERGASGNSGWGDSGESGWGTSEGNGWGNSGSSGWGAGGDNEWRTSGDNEGGKDNGWGDPVWGAKDARGPAHDASSARQGGKGETTKNPASATVKVTSKPIPLPSRKTSSSHMPLPASPVQVTNPPRIPFKIRTASLDNAVEPSLSMVPDSARPREPLSRVQVYSSTIKYIQQAVRLQLQLENAQAAVDRWKTTQLSSQYSRASPATRKILNERRADFSQDAADIAKRLKHAIGCLSDLPDLSTASGRAYSDVDENQIMEYTAQLKDWIGRLQLGSRIVPPSPPPENHPLRPQNGQSWTWDNIKESIAELERHAENVAEQICVKKFTHMMDILDPDEKIVAFLDAHHERENDKAALTERADVLLRNANEVGNELSEKVLLAAQLFTQVQRNEEELQKLRDEKRQRDAVNSKIEGYFTNFDEWRQEDSAQIQQLKDQIINLHTMRHPTRPLFDIEHIRPSIRELVIKTLENEVVPVINHFRAACTQNNERFIKEVDKKLKPTLDLTTDICCRAREEAALSEPA